MVGNGTVGSGWIIRDDVDRLAPATAMVKARGGRRLPPLSPALPLPTAAAAAAAAAQETC
jgi:hypothetical protein